MEIKTAILYPERDKRSVPYSNYPIHLKERILSRTKKGDNGCIEYVGNSGHKYGLISVTVYGNRKVIPAHRAMYMACHVCFDIPRNMYICHKCDNPRCVNIKHLFIGTPKDNSADMIKKGRQRKRDSYKPHTRLYKLTPDQVRAIRAEPDDWKCSWIAEKYGITQGYVSKLRNRKAKPLV